MVKLVLVLEMGGIVVGIGGGICDVICAGIDDVIGSDVPYL